MKKTTLAILLTLGLGTASLLACGGSYGHKGGSSEHKGGMFKMMKQLDLTKEQKTALETLRESHKAQRKAKMETMKENRKNMMSAMRPDMSQFMTADSFDKKAFKTQMTQKFEVKRTMMEQKRAERLDRKAEDMEKVFNILTPEQRIKLIKLSKEKSAKYNKK